MRSIITLLFLLLYHAALCQSGSNPQVTNSANPLSVQKPVVVSNKFYRQIAADPSNANAWLNYYKWTINTKDLSAEEKLQQQIQSIQSARQSITGSWQLSLMNFIHSGKQDKTLLDHALNNTSDKALVYPYAIQFAIITQNEKLLQEYAAALNELRPLSPALYEYHYNALMSASGGATVYAKGISDLAPMVVLQQVYGIRKDIKFRYYENKITDTANAYICLSAGKDIVRSYPGAAYSGLMIRLSGNQTTGELQQLAASFRLIQLSQLQRLEEEEIAVYNNYLPSFILLYRSYKAANSPEAEKWKVLIQKTARLTGNLETVNKMIGE